MRYLPIIFGLCSVVAGDDCQDVCASYVEGCRGSRCEGGKCTGLTGLTCAQAAEMLGKAAAGGRVGAIGPGAVGIRNIGSTCYLNSMLQIFAHSAPMLEFFVNLRDNRRVDELGEVDRQFIDSLQLILANMYTGVGIDNDRGLLTVLRDTLRLYADGGDLFLPNVESDVGEAVPKVLENLSRISASIAGASTDTVFGFTEVSERRCIETGVVGRTREPSNILFAEFGGATARNPLVAINLMDVFGSSRVPERVEGIEDCGRGPAEIRRVIVGEGPQTLVIGLKRFEFDMATLANRKIEKLVTIPAKFDLATLPLAGEAVGTYKLIGIVHHIGATIGGGHYTSEILNVVGERIQARRPDGSLVTDAAGAPVMIADRKWFNANDAVITQIDGPTLTSQTGYMFVYERID